MEREQQHAEAVNGTGFGQEQTIAKEKSSQNGTFSNDTSTNGVAALNPTVTEEPPMSTTNVANGAEHMAQAREPATKSITDINSEQTKITEEKQLTTNDTASTTNGTKPAFVPDKANPALYTNEKREIFMGESPSLDPGPNDCVVRMRCNGICGSDVHFWHTGRIGPLIVDCDHVLGHEGAGEVVWSGSNVKNLKPGDRVAVEPGVPCDNCYQCSTGNYNLCADVAFSGVPPYSGSIRRWHVHPSKFLHKLPENLSYSDGALLEPLSVVLHGFERSPVKLGEPTVICGAGPIGMCALAVAKASGAAPIVVTDLDEGRLKFAQQFVPSCIPFQIDLKKSAEETAKDIVKTCIDAGADQPRVVYECTGVQQSVVTACYLPRAAGEVMVIGVGKPIMNEIPFMHISLAEIDLKFINRYHHSWPWAIRLLQHKVIDLQPLVTHRYALEQAREALEASADRGSGSIKIHIEDNEP